MKLTHHAKPQTFLKLYQFFRKVNLMCRIIKYWFPSKSSHKCIKKDTNYVWHIMFQYTKLHLTRQTFHRYYHVFGKKDAICNRHQESKMSCQLKCGIHSLPQHGFYSTCLTSVLSTHWEIYTMKRPAYYPKVAWKWRFCFICPLWCCILLLFMWGIASPDSVNVDTGHKFGDAVDKNVSVVKYKSF